MEISPRDIPPLSGLIAFHRTATSGSVSAAAEQLHLTQSAVSRQIKALEDFLGAALFQRANHRMQLTTRGTRYLEEVEPLLAGLSAATSGVSGSRRHSEALNIATISTFGAKWLVPRLGSFLESYPEISLNVVTRLNLFDFNLDKLDAAIHFGPASWPGTTSTRLFGETVAAVAAPHVARRITNVEDVRRSRLLLVASRPTAWEDWFRAANATAGCRPAICVETFAMGIEAALAGLGLAIIPLIFIQEELTLGRLGIVLDAEIESPHSYHLITPVSKKNWSPIRKFTGWIQAIASDPPGTRAKPANAQLGSEVVR